MYDPELGHHVNSQPVFPHVAHDPISYSQIVSQPRVQVGHGHSSCLTNPPLQPHYSSSSLVVALP